MAPPETPDAEKQRSEPYGRITLSAAGPAASLDHLVRPDEQELGAGA